MKRIITGTDSKLGQLWVLDYFHRDRLRAYARAKGVRRGKTKQDTMDNLAASGKVRIVINSK